MQDTNKRYRRLVELSPDGMVVSQENVVVFANAAAARVFGADRVQQVLGKSLFELFDIDSHAHMRRENVRLAHRGTVRLTEEKICRLDGAVVDVEVTRTPLDEDGSTVQVVVRDITDRKRTETALRESEERLRLAFAGAQEGVWDWNVETGAVVYSARWKEMLGYAEHEVEPHVAAWERLLHPDDQQQARELSESLRRGGNTYAGEFRLRHKDGHYIHVLSRGFPIRREPGGPVVRIVGTHFDLTERRRAEAALRESEERLSLAFAGAQEGVWDWNLITGGVVYSTQWKQMLGYSEDEIEPHVSAWERLLHPDDWERARALNERVAGGGRTYEGEFRLRHKAGHYIHVLSRGLPVRREPDGPVVRIVGTHFDLTERKKADAERARTELLGRLVFAQEDERRRIAREMHDQFGEQLTALGRSIGVLKDACAEHPALCERVGALEAIAQQIDKDVDHLVWKLRPTALDDLGLRAALANYVHDWSARVGIEVNLHTAGLQEERLASEIETTLYRISQEALTNVAKHSKARKVDVIFERRGDHVLLIVEDDGVGFESEKPGRAGQGFGLLGMQERAALVGANLQIESTPGKGTTILMRMAVPSSDGQRVDR